MRFSKCLIAIAVAGVLPSVSQAVVYDKGSTTLTDSVFSEGVTVINGASVTVDAENISGKNFLVTNYSEHVKQNQSWTKAQSKLVLGTDSTENIKLTNNATDFASGIAIQGPSKDDYAGSTAEVNAKNFTVTAHSENYYAYGIYVMNASTNKRNHGDGSVLDENLPPVKLTINAENTYVNATTGVDIDPTYKEHRAIGMVVFSEGELEVNGNLYVNAATALATRGHAVVNINKENDPNRVIQLDGDINFNYDGETSGTPVQAFVTINLANEHSYINGDIVVNGVGIPEGYDEVKDMNLGLSNGGAWFVPKDSPEDPAETAAEVNLTMNDGLISIADESKTVILKSFEGTGGRIEAAATKNGDTIDHAKVQIKDMSSEASFDVAYLGLTADDITDVDAALEGMGDIIQAPDGSTYTQTNIIAEGDVMGEITQVVDSTGKVLREAQQRTNTKIDSLSSLTSLSIMQWRHEMNDLTKRMGELRDSPEGVGTWARLYGSEQEYGDQNVNLKSVSVQVGADVDVGDWKVGGAFSYTDGSSDMNNGTADSDVYSIAAYGTWLADNGLFVDLIGKYSWLDTDFEISNMRGSADNSALSFSAEIGWRFEPCAYGFIEPQAELTYGRIWGDDFTTSNNVKVSQDDFDSLIGRIGVRAGVKFPEKKGNLYVRVSGVHDFQGDSDMTASKNGQYSHVSDDLGGSWVEYGLGANFNLTDATYTYVDLERTSGGEVKEKWRWNVGLRTVF